MDGAELRLGRLFDRESGNSFIAAFDHGLTTRVAPEAGRAEEVVRKISACEVDGLLISPGLLRKTAHLFAYRGALSPIVRTDFAFLDERLKELGDRYRVLCAPKNAAALAAEGVVMYLIFGSEDADTFADNAQAVANAAQEAHSIGLPLIVEAVPWGSRVADRRDPEVLSYVCRMAAELGADAVKTEYTGDAETMAMVVESCPVPILVLGGPKTDSEEDLIRSTREAISAGARGVVYGRNIWQADDPTRISASIREAVHGAYARR